ncbi:MAG TPA: PQQ-dependent sugar dehydrogenase, partial [Gemmatimonadales bacterium]|nr:PQQ-dependent sugar dehydrogenase [Gemmatimonadales bacterium]
VPRMIALGLLSLLALAGCHRDTTSPGPNPAGVGLQEVASGLAFPLFLTSPPGDNARLFVVEKTGRIRIVRNGSLLSTPFLDLSSQVSNGSEQGLLGLAFHPGYSANGRFVVNYTNPSGDTRISVFRVSANPDIADPASEQVILSVDQPYSNHNGGMVTFGPDGKLYIGLGDGGSGGDPQGNGQNRNALLGKILRLEVSATGQVSVPGDNPFVGQPGVRPEIWSYGVRNPWRFSFDRQTNDLYIGDVGQSAREEVDVSTSATQFGRGLNYGWNRMEGLACYSPSSGCNQSGLTLPVLDYGHSDGCSVTGGYVYRGDDVPALKGLYFYADYCEGWIRSFRWNGTAASDQREWSTLKPGGQISSFGEDARGELYVMTSSGKVFRFVAVP